MKPFLTFYHELPNEFLPPELTKFPVNIVSKNAMDRRMAWRMLLCETFPRHTIPPKLTLKSGLSYQPPRFLFGWVMEQSVLCEIAKHCGFFKEAQMGATLRATVKLKRELMKKLPRVVEALGWVVVHPITTFNREKEQFKTFQCIALADSWITGHRKPSAEHIRVLREFFRIGEGDIKTINDEPMWWIDMLVPHLHYGYKMDNLRDYRPWDLQPRVIENEGSS